MVIGGPLLDQSNHPIRALDIQGHVPVENLGHGHDPLRHDDHLGTEHAAAAAPPRALDHSRRGRDP
jgi:hypothetical protein